MAASSFITSEWPNLIRCYVPDERKGSFGILDMLMEWFLHLPYSGCVGYGSRRESWLLIRHLYVFGQGTFGLSRSIRERCHLVEKEVIERCMRMGVSNSIFCVQPLVL